MNIPQSTSFHLVLDPALAAWPANGSSQQSPFSATPAIIVVPPGCSFLPISTSESPSLLSTSPASLDAILVLEPILTGDRQPRLALIPHGVEGLRVNGERAPRLALLREKDQFQFADSCIFHVAIYHRPQIGPAPAEKVAKPCPICLAPFTDELNSVCYRCQCGTVLHLQDPSGLECARAVHDCPHCHQPISLNEGYSWLPNFDS